jgi:aspartate racemase
MHIGLIGGIGPAATVYYYEQIVRAFAALGQALHLTIAHTSVQILAHNVATNQPDAQAAEYLRVTDQLQAAGADVVVITSMGGHFCAKEFAQLSPLPMIDGPQAVADYIATQSISRIGILGTRHVMQSHLYGTLDGFDPVIPAGDYLAQVDSDYVAMAKAGIADKGQRERLLSAGDRLVNKQGAQAVLLGGTDLTLAYADAAKGFRVIDSAQVHADAIVAHCQA